MTNRFDKIATEWDNKPSRVDLANKFCAKVLSLTNLNQTKIALDYGTGTGLILQRIQPYVSRIFGFDNSEEMLKVLQQKIDANNLANVEIKKHDIDKEIVGKGEFDLIVSNMTLHHIKDTQQFFEKCFEALRPEGELVIGDLITEDSTFHDPPNLGIFHLGFCSDDIMELMQKAGFIDVSVEIYHTIKKEDKEYPLFSAYGKHP